MQLFTRQDLDNLIATSSTTPCISIYMPTHRAGRETQQDPIRLKNLINQAENQLIELGLEKSRIVDLLSPLRNQHLDAGFWMQPADGLAIFLSDAEPKIYRLPLNLPELVYVADHFNVRPLLPLLSETSFYLLTLSLNLIQLYHVTQSAITEMNLHDMPTSIAAALRYDDPESQLQPHTNVGSTTGREAIFHGHDPADDARRKKDILRFFQIVNKGISKHIAGQNIPLILAGTDYLLPIYREANTYPHLLEESLAIGNPAPLSPQELHHRVWSATEPYRKQPQQDRLARFQAREHTATTSNALEEILPAAYQGRVDTLLIAEDAKIWGTYNPDTYTVTVHSEPAPTNQDLLELAILQTFLNSGEVFKLDREEIPQEDTVAALFRY